MTSGATIYTATAGVQGNYHFLPWNDWDPWIGPHADPRAPAAAMTASAAILPTRFLMSHHTTARRMSAETQHACKETPSPAARA